MSHQETHTDDVYLNDYHREWNERCMKENARVQSMHFSVEQARAQSRRMKDLVRQERELSRQRRGS